MRVKCLINGDIWPVKQLSLSEGYNEGWTFSSVIPGLTDREFSSITFDIENYGNKLNISMELDELTEDGINTEICGRDKASRRLAHSYYDGSTLHCIGALPALSAICSFASVKTAGTTKATDIHYASNDTQPALGLIVDMLETTASRYNSDGETFHFSPTYLDSNADHILTDVISASFTNDYEARYGGIILTKSTPCDINQTVTIAKAPKMHPDNSGKLMAISSNLSASVPDMSKWNQLCQAAEFNSKQPDYIYFADGTKATLPTDIAYYALCRASGQQNVKFTYIPNESKTDDYKHLYQRRTIVYGWLNYNGTKFTPNNPPVTHYQYSLGPFFYDDISEPTKTYVTIEETKYLLAEYDNFVDLGVMTEDAVAYGTFKMYCVSKVPEELYPLEGKKYGEYDPPIEYEYSTLPDGTKKNTGIQVFGTAFSQDLNSGPATPSLDNNFLNCWTWNGQSDFTTELLGNISHSGRLYTNEGGQSRTSSALSRLGAVLYRYADGNLVYHGNRHYRTTQTIGPEIPPTSAYPFWHVKKDVVIEFAKDCDLIYNRENQQTSGSGNIEKIGEFSIHFGPSYLNPDFNPTASVPSWTDENGNTVKQTEDLYAGPTYIINYDRNASAPGETEIEYSRSSSVSLGIPARVISSAVTYPRSKTVALDKHNDVETINFADYMPVGDQDVTQITLVGVSQTSCPPAYDPSFTIAYPVEKPSKPYSRMSTHWKNKDETENYAPFYMWWANRNCNTATFTLPLRLDIKSGQLVRYKSNKYIVLTANHNISINECYTEINCSKI